MPDMFVGNNSSIYWFWHGVNLRSVSVYIIVIIPSFRKLHHALLHSPMN